jgi:2-polyprenyl-3-methyl-5-hydroxy-6-metoxy-1,4-benzoquinol methylase
MPTAPLERINYIDLDSPLEIYLHKKRYILASKVINGKVLDIGCGFGFGTQLMANKRPDCHFYGIDVDQKAIDYACKNQIDRNLEFRIMDATNLDFGSGYFDSVVSIENIEHVSDSEKYLSEVSRVLKKGGTLFLTTPNDDRFEHRVYRFFGKKIRYNPYHAHEFSYSEIRHLLKKHGFSISKQGGLSLYIIPMRGIFIKLYKIPLIYKFFVNFAPMGISDYFYFVCQKR